VEEGLKVGEIEEAEKVAVTGVDGAKLGKGAKEEEVRGEDMVADLAAAAALEDLQEQWRSRSTLSWAAHPAPSLGSQSQCLVAA